MALATSVIAQEGRNVNPFIDLAFIPVTFTLSTTAYVTATGGVAVDLTAALTSGGQPFSIPYINPLDVLFLLPVGLSTNKFLPGALAIGAYTFTNPALYPFAGGNASNYVPAGTSNLGPNVRPDLQLATCPATIRLYATGAGNAAAFAEIADGNLTDAFTVLLVIARNGPNL